jgi:hypothetical protein
MVLLLFDEVESTASEFHDPSILAAARDMSEEQIDEIDDTRLAESLEGDEKRQEVTKWMLESVCRTS